MLVYTELVNAVCSMCCTIVLCCYVIMCRMILVFYFFPVLSRAGLGWVELYTVLLGNVMLGWNWLCTLWCGLCRIAVGCIASCVFCRVCMLGWGYTFTYTCAFMISVSCCVVLQCIVLFCVLINVSCVVMSSYCVLSSIVHFTVPSCALIHTTNRRNGQNLLRMYKHFRAHSIQTKLRKVSYSLQFICPCGRKKKGDQGSQQ